MKIAAGNPGKRSMRRDEPKPDPGIPDCPKHLSKIAREEWDRITRELSKIAMITLVDRSALAAYCAAYSRWVEAEKLLAGGLTYSNGGLTKTHPAVRIAHDAMVLMHKYLSEFGLSPASRTRIGTGEKAPEDEYEEFARSAG